ncbi:MAG: J domain-containing protein [Deltaproteobacteria bacterium]|nr:J domain-containing protein [Deltaproteobacteria bacterium]
MAGRIYLPREVQDSIRAHIGSAVGLAIDGYYSAEDDEDTLTGHLGAKLQIRNQKVDVPQAELPGVWTWSIDYVKFRGRGGNAAETYLGADGLFEIKVRGGRRVDQKSILFQAKKNGSAGRELVEQCVRLSTWKEAAFVLNFTPEEFYGLSLDKTLSLARTRGEDRLLIGQPLAEFLSEEFLQCRVGDTDLRYDARAKRLLWRTQSNNLVQTQFSIPQRITLDIKPPQYQWDAFDGVTLIENDEIHEHRMKASAAEILGLDHGATVKELRAARKTLSLAYHTDGRDWLVVDDLRHLNRRMQEINDAYDQVEERIKDKGFW